MIKIYGIKNCDTVKKVLKQFEELSIEYTFVNFKKTPPSKKNISDWTKFFGELPVNKRGTTYRKLKESFETASDTQKIEQLIKNSSMIKRPIIEHDNQVICIGFDKDKIQSLA